MKNADQNKSSTEVPQRIFEQFVEKLTEDKVPALAVERLRVLLLSEKSLTEKAVTDAVLSEDPIV